MSRTAVARTPTRTAGGDGAVTGDDGAALHVNSGWRSAEHQDQLLREAVAEHGASYGLCPIYGNEPWHDELRPEAIDRRCPRPYADPTHDPRTQG